VVWSVWTAFGSSGVIVALPVDLVFDSDLAILAILRALETLVASLPSI